MNRFAIRFVVLSFCLAFLFSSRLPAQATLGSINGTVTDKSGAVVQGASVKARNVTTNLEQNATTKNDGSFSIVNLPIATYSVTISKEGFKTEVYSEILVRGGLTTTVNAALEVGQVTATVTVEATPLMNQTDTTNGYTLSSDLIDNLPLGTGSFTQLAILAPGVSEDLLGGAGTNEGLGNQAIWANGQRDTSNDFTFNSVDTTNLFNGKSTSYDNTARFILNTGGFTTSNGQTQTNTSVYDAIGQGLPTPPPETIEELHVTTSMYDASQGAHSGAHIELTTKSGTNQFHGMAYEYHGTNGWDADPVFVKALGVSTPNLDRNIFGGNVGGPIMKDKLFFFVSYQGQRITDALSGSLQNDFTLPGLTDTNRDPTDLANLVNAAIGTSLTAADVDPTALSIFQAKTPSGQFIIPSQNLATPTPVGNTVLHGPPSTFDADQVNGDIDYNVSASDRLSGKYYYQRNPTTSPFAISSVFGFPSALDAGSQVFSLNNTTALTPNVSWIQRIGFTRQAVNGRTNQQVKPSDITDLNLPNNNFFPGITIDNSDGNFHELFIGPSLNFANAGIFQNQFEIGSSLNWVHGRHSFSFGFTGDYGQLNVLNRENDIAIFEFEDISDFLQGILGAEHSNGTIISGETNRYFRAKQAGLYAQDDFKLRSNVTIDLGIRWDWDGPLYEAHGEFTNFEPKNYDFDLSTDTIVNDGLVVAGNNKQFGTQGVSPSTLTAKQWMFEPRIGVAWSPSFLKNVVVRAGFGLYADRGEYFTEFSNSAGLGISGPFGVTTEEPFALPVNASCASSQMCLSSTPFPTPLPAPPSLSQIQSEFPNLSAMSGCSEPVVPTCTPSASPVRPFLFAGYDPRNKLPYSENWSLDLQWQPINTLLLTLGYIGNHGVHEVMPIPFNTPGIATASNPINGQNVSYGAQPLFGGNCDAFNDITPTCAPLANEQIQTIIGNFVEDGNTALRSPFVGLNPNSSFWEAEGISHYNALQLGFTKRLSHGLQITANYTYSHALDEQSGDGLFFTGNNPLDPRSSYASSDFDRTHVFNISYVYQFPKIANASRAMDLIANGWGLRGITVAESGQPFSMYDFSGSVGSLYYSGDDFITNPILPLAPGVTPKQAQQDTIGYNAKNPYVNPNDFTIPFVAPSASNGIPCNEPTIFGNGSFCDTIETGFGNTGRNTFRAPFQARFDFSVFKNFKISERLSLKYEANFYNIFNHPSFDAPFNNITLLANGSFFPQPVYQNPPPASQFAGVIQDSLGGPRIIQMAVHLIF
jgi:hypothetical protein